MTSTKDETYDASSASLLEIYWKGVRVVGGFTGVIVFIGSWIFCIAAYGFLFGVGLGWVPSAIVAIISAAVVGLLWPLAVLGVFLVWGYLVH